MSRNSKTNWERKKFKMYVESIMNKPGKDCFHNLQMIIIWTWINSLFYFHYSTRQQYLISRRSATVIISKQIHHPEVFICACFHRNNENSMIPSALPFLYIYHLKLVTIIEETPQGKKWHLLSRYGERNLKEV